MRITIDFIPQRDQRYATAGDWYFDADGNLAIRVTNLRGPGKFLVAIHELVEALLCDHHHIEQEDVDRWDMAFEGDGEPGDHPDAPYWAEHFFAEMIERVLSVPFGVNWHEYERELAELG